ncbi:MAG: DUF115 domain-containing protein [Spirochaetes bacterium]|nr:MAG: DUF115 domain-containing protein [Spirochaetota bacterium]
MSPADYFLSDTPSGWKTITRRNGREVRLHSSYDPMIEAERAVSSFDKKRATILLVSGAGLGYHVRLLAQKYPGCRIIVIEESPEVIRLARTHYPENFEDVLVACSIQEVPAALESLEMGSFRGFAFFTHRPSYSLAPAFYDAMIRDITRFLSSKLSDLLTRFEFEERWVENILSNLHRVFTAPTVQGLFGRFRGCPGIIVSAGPSLRKNASLLEGMKDRALVVAVDTALKVLLRRGVTPHMVITLDAQKHSLRHFLGSMNSGAALVADLVSFPRIADLYPGRVFVSTTAKYFSGPSGETCREPTPMMDWIERYIEPVGDIQSGGSVATSAFDLLLNLGCSPIILVGQDLAYTGREIHASGTYHNDGWLPRTSRFQNLDSINQGVVRKRRIKRVEAYGGNGTVIADYVFDLYRGWFEDSALKVNFPVINATEGGARIRNTREQDLRSLAESMKPLYPAPGDILRAPVPTGSRTRERIVSALDEAIGRVKETAAQASGPEGSEGAIALVEDDFIRPLYNPFLRKTHAYLARHPDMDPAKAAAMLSADIAQASRRLAVMLERCRARLAELS